MGFSSAFKGLINPEAVITVKMLLMMSENSLETCTAVKEQ